LTRLAQRIASRTFPSHDIEEELAELVRARNGGISDRFDRLVSDCVILDLPGPMTRNDLFRAISEKLATRLDMPPNEILRLLHERENLSSTVVRQGLAIPHILVDGGGRFDVLLARIRGGAEFSPDDKPVFAVFVLIGSSDERNYHLRALTAVAEIAQDPSFDKRWHDAKDADELRQSILQSKRRRIKERLDTKD